LRFALAFVFLVALTAVVGCAPSHVVGSAATRTGAAMPPVAGSWRRLPAAPIVPSLGVVSVWTGRQMLIFGRAQPDPPWSVNVAAAYSPGLDTWQLLAPPPGPAGNYEGQYSAVWTGKEMLVSGPATHEAFNPVTNLWRSLPKSAVPDGIVVWTGREMIGWGGGCCGDASSEGAAYNPATNTRRTLARSPLAPEQRPIGAWTGRELVLFVSGVNPADGKRWPARLARAAAYDPVTDAWRRIAPLPAGRTDANAVWDGREVLIVGGTGAPRARTGVRSPAAVGFAYNPGTNYWRRLPRVAGRAGAAAVWTGKRLLIWGGTAGAPSGVELVTPNQGLAYDPKANRWSPLPGAPLLGRLDPTAVWTGQAMIVWGGHRPAIPEGRVFADGAAFRPSKP
jgi:N-acetylneuraminic acid mutarotase